jgi:hypothetical protein
MLSIFIFMGFLSKQPRLSPNIFIRSFVLNLALAEAMLMIFSAFSVRDIAAPVFPSATPPVRISKTRQNFSICFIRSASVLPSPKNTISNPNNPQRQLSVIIRKHGILE